MTARDLLCGRRPTVFISSRMDELAMERRSAYSAVYSAGLIPLLFEIEPPKKDKEKIDLLVDRADFFLGLYYLSFGNRNADLCGLRPVEYEFYRFATRFIVTNSPNTWELSEIDRDQIDLALADESWISTLGRRLQGGKLKPAHEKGLRTALSRVLLLQRVSKNDDLMVSSDLGEFLASFPSKNRHDFYVSPEKAPEEARELITETLFIPAYVSLYHVVHNWAEAIDESIEMPKGARDTHIQCLVRGVNKPGLLVFVLESFFQYGLNIYGLCGGELTHPDGSTSAFIQINSRVFQFDQAPESLLINLKDRISYIDKPRALGHALDGHGLLHSEPEVRTINRREDNTLQLDAGLKPTLTDQTTCLAITTYDVPGMAMGIAKCILHFPSDIKFICTGDFAPKFSTSASRGTDPAKAEILVAFETTRKDSHYMEYQLSSLLGVVNLRRITPAEVENQFRHLHNHRRTKSLLAE